MRVTAEHWSVFLQIAEKNPQLITNKFNGIQGKAHGNALWQSVSDRLNSLGHGQKSVIEWRRAVTDWKSKVKVKAAKIRCAQAQTGGGGIAYTPLSSIEENLLSLMGKKAFEGDAEVVELGLAQNVEVISTPSTSSGNTTHLITSFDEQVEQLDCFNEHSYTSCALSMSRKIANTNSEKLSRASKTEKENHEPKAKRRKIGHIVGISKNLQDMSQQTVNILERIDKNMQIIAESMQELIEIFKNQNQNI